MRLLVVEHDQKLEGDLRFWMKFRWPKGVVTTARTAREGLTLAREGNYDVVIADLDPDDMGGGAFVRLLRAFSDTQLIVITQERSSQGLEMVRVLEAGADDCISHPLNIMDLLARTQRCLRRARSFKRLDEEDLVAGALRIRAHTREVFLSGRPIFLTSREHELLTLLAKSKGRYVSPQVLFHGVWGGSNHVSSDRVKDYVYRLRKKLGDDQGNRRIIVGKRSLGYMLNSSPRVPRPRRIA